MTEYRIDDLARAAGTTSRNVRAYQERGLLPPPEKRGRVGIYGDAHLERLKLIDTLLQRGFTTAHIDDFITGWESGKDLTEVLGLQHAVTEPWSRSDTVSIEMAVVREFSRGRCRWSTGSSRRSRTGTDRRRELRFHRSCFAQRIFESPRLRFHSRSTGRCARKASQRCGRDRQRPDSGGEGSHRRSARGRLAPGGRRGCRNSRDAPDDA